MTGPAPPEGVPNVKMTKRSRGQCPSRKAKFVYLVPDWARNMCPISEWKRVATDQHAPLSSLRLSSNRDVSRRSASDPIDGSNALRGRIRASFKSTDPTILVILMVASEIVARAGEVCCPHLG